MRNLIQFFIRYSVFFLFLILETLSFVLILKSNEYQRSAFFSSANTITADLYKISNSVVEFFSLRSENANLSEENAQLHNQIVSLENKLNATRKSDSTYIPAENNLSYISAKVINNSTNKPKNYLTINKGLRDGIMPDMGVVCSDGVVGVIRTVSEKFSVVIPILNSDLSINCKFKNSNYIGPLRWLGSDYRYANLIDIARHVQVHVGDTLITSGLTSVFPEGIPVGQVERFKLDDSDAYYTILVRLSVNFRTLSYVNVIKNAHFKEQKSLETEVLSLDDKNQK